MERVVVTNQEDIQNILDGVNSFHFTGSSIKDIFRYGLFSGGSVLYGFDVFLTGGGEKEITFASNNGDQSMGDIEVSGSSRPSVWLMSKTVATLNRVIGSNMVSTRGLPSGPYSVCPVFGSFCSQSICRL